MSSLIAKHKMKVTSRERYEEGMTNTGADKDPQHPSGAEAIQKYSDTHGAGFRVEAFADYKKQRRRQRRFIFETLQT